MRSRFLMLILYLVVIMMLTASVIASASWSFQGEIKDDVNDVGGNPAFTDIVKVDYGFNETHFSVNITMKGEFNLTENEHVWIGVLIDSDMDQTTGFSYEGIGADHLLEVWLTKNSGGAALYGYAGQGGTDWGWSPLQNHVYMEIQDKVVSTIAEKGSIPFPKGEIRIVVYTTYKPPSGGSTTVDTTVPSIFPIPEHLLVSIAVGLSVLVVLYKIRDRLPM